MAPNTPIKLTDVDKPLRSAVNNLYMIISQVYDHQGASTTEALKNEVITLAKDLHQLTTLAPHLTDSSGEPFVIPPEVIVYVQDGRNPDIYSREFVELAMKNNQRLKGKQLAFEEFRDILAKQIVGAVPELESEVGRVVAGAGGTRNEG